MFAQPGACSASRAKNRTPATRARFCTIGFQSPALPKDRGRISMQAVLRKCEGIGAEIKAWGAKAKTSLEAQCAQVRKMTRKESVHENAAARARQDAARALPLYLDLAGVAKFIQFLDQLRTCCCNVCPEESILLLGVRILRFIIGIQIVHIAMFAKCIRNVSTTRI